MISRALADEKLPVYGNGENVRDWLHVCDHCAAIDPIIHKERVGEVYNIGGHNKRTNYDRNSLPAHIWFCVSTFSTGWIPTLN